MQDDFEMADEHEMTPRPREQMSQDVSVRGHDLFPGHNSGSAAAGTDTAHQRHPARQRAFVTTRGRYEGSA
jgi:hypothetical protein